MKSDRCYRIYDVYHGLILEKSTGKKAGLDFKKLMEEFSGNFYYRVFNESFDFAFIFGDMYFSRELGTEETTVYLADELINKAQPGCNVIKAYRDSKMPGQLRYFALGSE